MQRNPSLLAIPSRRVLAMPNDGLLAYLRNPGKRCKDGRLRRLRRHVEPQAAEINLLDLLGRAQRLHHRGRRGHQARRAGLRLVRQEVQFALFPELRLHQFGQRRQRNSAEGVLQFGWLVQAGQNRDAGGKAEFPQVPRRGELGR